MLKKAWILERRYDKFEAGGDAHYKMDHRRRRALFSCMFSIKDVIDLLKSKRKCDKVK